MLTRVPTRKNHVRGGLKGGQDKGTDEQKLEELQEVRRILRKDEEKWTSTEYYDLLRWKMGGQGHSSFKTKAQRKQKWQDILSGLLAEGEEELADVMGIPGTDAEPNDGVSLSRENDPRRVHESEHVDGDEYFAVNDTPWQDIELVRAEREKNAFIKSILTQHEKDLEGKTEEERQDFAYQKWGDSWDDQSDASDDASDS
jgi:hypothetical protein